MNKNYLEYLTEELSKAEVAFEEAKAEAVKKISSMDPWQAHDFGAGYASQVERITRAASKIMILRESLKAFEYYSKNS